MTNLKLKTHSLCPGEGGGEDDVKNVGGVGRNIDGWDTKGVPATHCNTLQHAATIKKEARNVEMWDTATHCNTLQHAATREKGVQNVEMWGSEHVRLMWIEARCVCVCICMHVCVCVYARACACACA